ncbi:MAG: cryptochrome/photolyase family protein [Azospirillum sp.]|nr:cryptochrome/photolyase family protein [Azospirillum sp.]
MTCRSLRFILNDQLDHALSALADAGPGLDRVMFAEVLEEATSVGHHPKKLALQFSAQRHFAAELASAGHTVDYVGFDAPDNTGSLRTELVRAVARHRPERVIMTEPGAWRIRHDMVEWPLLCGVPVEIRNDDRFFCSIEQFAAWAKGRAQPGFDAFYAWMRRRTGILLTPTGQPEGGRWRCAHDGSRPLSATAIPPEPLGFAPDALTVEVIALVRRRFGTHFGALEPFRFPVRRCDARASFDRYRSMALPGYADHLDLIRQGHPWLFHAGIAAFLNLGLLAPREVCAAVEADFRAGHIALPAAEAFIRQILGWREYLRGLYWLKMPDYAELNHFGAYGPLPSLFWSGETAMNCLRQTVESARRSAYVAHRQRLMVAGNFALLAGIAPKEAADWFLAVHADAQEWLTIPHVIGRATYADGGLVGTRPIAVGGRYLARISDYCRGCTFDVARTVGDSACPFNYLYWNFMAANRNRLAGNPHMKVVLTVLETIPPAKLAAIRDSAESFLNTLT